MREGNVRVERGLLPSIWMGVSAIPVLKWCKHAFSVYPKCNTLVNNMCELFIGIISQAR